MSTSTPQFFHEFHRKEILSWHFVCFSAWHSSAHMRSTLNPTALRKAKIVCNFGLSECNRLKERICSWEIIFFPFRVKQYLPQQSSRKVQDCRTKPANFHFVLQKILGCLTKVLWILAKKIIFWQQRCLQSCRYLFCPAKDFRLSDSCPASVEKISRGLPQ